MSTLTPPSPEDAPQQFTSSKDAKAQAKAAKAYKKASRPWFKKKRFWLLGIIALLIIIAIATQGGDDTETPSDSPNQNAAQQPAEADEEAIEVTAQQMIEDLEGNALKAKTTYEGKLVTITGYVGNIDASGDYFSLDPEPEAVIFTGIQVRLDESHLETVSNFSQGQETTVTGTVASVGEVLGYSIDADSVG